MTNAPARYQPPKLTKSQLAWRYGIAVGHVLLCAVTLIATAWVRPPRGGFDVAFWSARTGPPLAVDFVLGVLAIVAAGFRRRYPLPIALVVIMMNVFSIFSLGAWAWVLVSLSTRRRRAEIACCATFSVLAPTATEALLMGLGVAQADWPNLGAGALIMVFMVCGLMGLGMYIGAHRDLKELRAVQAAQELRERELYVERIRESERQRIAREMHDVLAHRISLVSLHAAALAHRSDLTPAQIKDVAKTIQDNAHESLTELRWVLSSLRSSGEVEKPQPTLSGLGQLIHETTQVGTEVDLEVDADLTTVTTTSSRHAYRIVQEGLTNARKHAPGTRVSVRMHGSPEEGLSIKVANPLRVGSESIPGFGIGLAGLGERAKMVGGKLSYETRDNQFELRAWLPW